MDVGDNADDELPELDQDDEMAPRLTYSAAFDDCVK